MRARVVAQNKKYLVEFKSDEQMITFLTNHSHKIQKFDIISENEIPAMKKSFEMQKISQPTGWKTIEKSSIVNKETGAETKSMKLGGKYNTFKYEPDASLESNTSNKNSKGSIDTPALKGDEPKVSSVKDTKEVKSVKQPTTSNEDGEETETEDKEEKQNEEIDESIIFNILKEKMNTLNESNSISELFGYIAAIALVGVGIGIHIYNTQTFDDKVKTLGKKCEIVDVYDNGSSIDIVCNTSLNPNGEIDTHGGYISQLGQRTYRRSGFKEDNLMQYKINIKYNDEFGEKNPTKITVKPISSDGQASIRYLRDNNQLKQGMEELINSEVFSNEMGKKWGPSIDKENEEIKESVEDNSIDKEEYEFGYTEAQSWFYNGNRFDHYDNDEVSDDFWEGFCDGWHDAENDINKFEVKESAEDTKKVSEGVKDYLPRGGFIKDDETEHKEGIWGGQGTDEQIRKAKLIAKVKHANGDRMGRVTKEDLDNYEYYLEQYKEIFGLDESKKSDKKVHIYEDNEFEKTHECSWCGEKFPESDMKCEKDMGWLCNHDWKYLETREGNLEECDPTEIGLDETETNEDYQNGIEEGFKDGLKKAGKFAKNAVAGAAVAGSLLTANPANAQISPDGTNSTDGYLQAQVEDDGQQQLTYAEIVKAGKPITLNGHTYTVQELEQMKQEQGFDEADMDDIVNGIDPYYDGATRP